MFYNCKNVSDRFLNDQDLVIEDPDTIEISNQNRYRKDREAVARMTGHLKTLIFTNYRFLLEKQNLTILFYEYVIKLYPGGEEFEGFLEFLRGVIGSCEHPYRSNDLNFRVRMIAHHLQYNKFAAYLTQRVLTGENIKDPHQAISLIKAMSAPKGIPYYIFDDYVFMEILEAINSARYFVPKFFFTFTNDKVMIVKKDEEPFEITPITGYDKYSEANKSYVYDYLSMIATMAQALSVSKLRAIFAGDMFSLSLILKNKQLDFDLRSQFLNILLNGFTTTLRNRVIHSNNFYNVSKHVDTIADEYWEVQPEIAITDIKDISPIMFENSQEIEDMYQNISFEIQKQRFFNTMLKYNMFFEMKYDQQDWIGKVFDHCLKMILLCLVHNTSEEHSKIRNRTYEVNENYPLDFVSQKSVFHLHFWFKKSINRNNDSTPLESFDLSKSQWGEKKVQTDFTTGTVRKILTEALVTLHYLVEIRHKYLCGSISDTLHDRIWSTGIKHHTNDFLTHEELIDYVNRATQVVLNEVVHGSHSTVNISAVPSIQELFSRFTSSNEDYIFRGLNLDKTDKKDANNFKVPTTLDKILMKILNLDLTDTNIQQSCITLIAKVKSEATLRLRKIEKSHFVAGDNYYKSARLFAGLSNVTAYDFRCLPGTSYSFEDPNRLGIPELTHMDFKSDFAENDEVFMLCEGQLFYYPAYYVNNVYDQIVKRYKDKSYKHFDPSSQDMARTLKLYDNLMWLLYRYEQFFTTTNLDAFEAELTVSEYKLLQEPFFTKIFDSLKAIVYKNEKMQKVMWKHKEFLVFEKRALSCQYGELDLINYILDNNELLHESNRLDDFATSIFKRMSSENYEVVIQILSKISTSNVTHNISLLTMDLLNEGKISDALGKIDETSPETFNSFVIMLTNYLKCNRTIILRNNIINKFNFSLLFEKMKDSPKQVLLALQDRFDNNEESQKTDRSKPITKFTIDGYNFKFKFLKDVFEPTTQEYVESCGEYIETLFELYKILYFSIFVADVNHVEQMTDLANNFIDPLHEHLIRKETSLQKNHNRVISRTLPKFCEQMISYLKLLLSDTITVSKTCRFLAQSCITKILNIRGMADKYMQTPVLKFNSGETINISRELPPYMHERIPDSQFRVANDSVVESTFFRVANEKGEDYYWNNQKYELNPLQEDLKKFRARYDQEYDQAYLNEFYQVINFRNVWQNSCNMLVS